MSFMSVVPSNNPEAVFYIAIDNPKNTALLSSYTTAPVARRVLLDIIDALDIKRQDDAIEKKMMLLKKEDAISNFLYVYVVNDSIKERIY